MYISGGYITRRLWFNTARNFGGKEKTLKVRINAIDTIEKITKSMKLVASSKMKFDMRLMDNGKKYGIDSIDTIFKSDLYMQRKMPSEPDKPKELLVPITTDKGLCGAINSGLLRFMRDYMGHDQERFSILCIGDKGANAMRKQYEKIFHEAVTNLNYPVNFGLSLALSDKIIRASKDHDSICIFYNKFINAITFKPTMVRLMTKRFHESMEFQRLYEMEKPDASTTVPALYEYYIATSLYHAQIQNAASEQCSRMVTMDNASKNAAELSKKLTLEYNKARQQSITIELCEIISGAESM
eukprot:CAMPEP_0168325742 /NCGR_PEP_ID=MMETSP0213-20121227/4871_1 /TAXON_ID=151035 /ORGANISM="Euplotes harpa, Strain FSP1.4" /LENGTH=298 /DNA_ID=CAMNT_0008328289 /DNA_START=8 /DNA_END=904 /DNA_ORIENTATION=-